MQNEPKIYDVKAILTKRQRDNTTFIEPVIKLLCLKDLKVFCVYVNSVNLVGRHGEEGTLYPVSSAAHIKYSSTGNYRGNVLAD